MPKGRFRSSSSSSSGEDKDSFDADPDFDAGGKEAQQSAAKSKNGAAKTNGAAALNRSKSAPKAAKLSKNSAGSSDEEEGDENVFANYSSYVPGTGIFTAVPDFDDDEDVKGKRKTSLTNPMTSNGRGRDRGGGRGGDNGGRGSSKAKRARGKPTGERRKTGNLSKITDLSIPFTRTEGLSFEGERIPTDGNVCFICQDEFDDFRDLTSHCEQEHEGKEWNKCQCPICGKQFKGASWKTHVDLVHLKVRNHRCDVCLRFFFTRHDLIRHQNGAHNNVTFACQLCDSTYNNDGGLRAHYRKAHDSRIEMFGDDCVTARIIPLSEGGGRSAVGEGGKGGGSSGRKRGRGRGGAASSSSAAVKAMEAIFNSGGGVSKAKDSGLKDGGGTKRVGRPSRGGPASSRSRGASAPRIRGGPASRSRGGIKFKSKSLEPDSKSKQAVETVSSVDDGEGIKDDEDDDVDDDDEEEEVDDDAIDELLRRSNGGRKPNATAQKRQRTKQTPASDEDGGEDEDDDDENDNDDDRDDDSDDDDYRISKLKPSSASPSSSTTFSSALKPKSLSYECMTCGRRFTLRHLLEFHLTKQHGLSMEKAKEGRHWKVAHVCRDCDAQFQGEEDLEIHRQRMHGAVAGGGGSAGTGGGGDSSRGGMSSTTAQQNVVPRGKARRSRGGGGVFRGSGGSSGEDRGGSPSLVAQNRGGSLEYRLIPAPLPPPKTANTPPAEGNPASKSTAKVTPKSLKRTLLGTGWHHLAPVEAEDDEFSVSEEEDDNSNDSDFVA